MSTEVTLSERGGVPMCTSLDVAEKFHKRHDRVIRALEDTLGNLPKNEETEQMFEKSTYLDKSNREYPMYYMNRDGFSLLAMGFTGKEALQWKLKYIQAFNAMEAHIKQELEQQPDRSTVREFGKTARKACTDEIKAFVEYAEGQGSKHASMYYMSLSKMENKIVGVKRAEADTNQLVTFVALDEIVRNKLKSVREERLPYKDGYGIAKSSCEGLVASNKTKLLAVTV